MTRSEQLFREASRLIPGGVNSPVRAFRSVGITPRFIAKADGQHIYDADGNAYTDYVGSWGPMILGHNHSAVRQAVIEAVQDGLSFGAATEREVGMAKLICELVPSIRRLLPRAFRRDAGKGRFRRDDRGCAGQCRSPPRMRAGHADRGL